MSVKKEELYQRVKLKIETEIEGINVDPKIFADLKLGVEHREQVHGLFEMDHFQHGEVTFPCDFTDPYGIVFDFQWDPRSKFNIQYENGVYYLYERKERLFPIVFSKRPKYYGMKTSDGTEMSKIGNFSENPLAGGFVNIAYSNECALKDKGLDCLFCNINATKDTYAEKENLTWKTPKQIAEAVKAATEFDHLKHINITGGFIPERREVDYYVDVAEAIYDEGVEDFNAQAVIGAPSDLSVIDKYKEAGYHNLAINMEVWDENFFSVICPGKAKECGGRENWIKALEYAGDVFGFGRIRCNFVSGIEPKEKTLEGVEFLAERGIIGTVSTWNPNPGSKLEGHRTPDVEWHYDLKKKVYQIYRKVGFTYQQILDVDNNPNAPFADFYRIDEGLLPILSV